LPFPPPYATLDSLRLAAQEGHLSAHLEEVGEFTNDREEIEHSLPSMASKHFISGYVCISGRTRTSSALLRKGKYGVGD